MREEDVPAELVKAASDALWAAGNKPKHLAAAIAAVAPLIAKAERERCAGIAKHVAETHFRQALDNPEHGHQRTHDYGASQAASGIAAAIHALD